MDPGDRIIRKNTKDRCILFVGGGSLMHFKDGESETLGEGSVIGAR